MEWVYLLIAGIFEVGWAVSMKLSEGFTKLVPSVVTAVGSIASAVFLALALRKLPLGTAYAMWTGFGILGTTILGALMFRETISLPQAGCVIMIAAGIIGLKLLS
ncbi:MAG: multidrug efflux SMR transporter [Mogibacterium sp.]|nr:multidrug efflux SMR transporter [Mogibacterium sp.]